MMNINSLLKGADESVKKPANRPNSAFSKPTMSKLAGFEAPKEKEEPQSKVVEDKQPTQNKVAAGLSKLFDKAEEMKKQEPKETGFLNPNSEAGRVKRPQTAKVGTKRASFFSRNTSVSNQDQSMSSESSSSGSSSKSESSESEEDKLPEPQTSDITMSNKPMSYGFRSPNVNRRRNKKGRRFKNSSKHIEIVTVARPINTPGATRRSILINNKEEANTLKNNFVMPMEDLTAPKPLKPAKKEKKAQPPPLVSFNKRQSMLMTPSQSVGNSRKLLQMSTVGGSEDLLGSKVKEEHHVQNMKPSNEFFSFDKMNYVQQLREDRQAIQAWNRSFAESINEIKVEYKDIFKKTIPRFQKQFAKAPGIRKKTIVFGLDRVLVKTNFEKESDDWKATTLTLNEDTGSRIQIYVSVRPFVKNTLQQLRRADYELVLYSTSQYNYTSAILDILQKQRIEFHHIITSEDHEEALMSEYNIKKQTVPSKNMNLFLHNRKERDIIFVD